MIRLVLAVMAGGLALAFGAQTSVLALNIGASAPLILKALAQSIPPSIQIESAVPTTSIIPPAPSAARATLDNSDNQPITPSR
jgi:hypothetical protein